jgi:hypothetical protein
MINFSFCESNHKGDVPYYEFNKFKEFEKFLEHIFEKKENGKKVYVCFNAWRDDIDYSKGEQDFYTFMITSQPQDEILISELSRLSDFNGSCADFYDDDDNLIQDNEHEYPYNFDYTIFEYNTYNEAFDFCKDLMQGITRLN